MPYDPTKPQLNSPVASAELRSQFNGLIDIINANHGSTSANSNGVATLGLGVSNPPQQSEVQQLADKLDELINTLRR